MECILIAAKGLEANRSNSWSAEEECILFGVILSKFLYRGSLFMPYRVVKVAVSNPTKYFANNEGPQKICPKTLSWQNISSVFHYLKWKLLKNHLVRRTSALERRFKTLKLRNAKAAGSLFANMEKEWNERWNINCCVLDPNKLTDDVWRVVEQCKRCGVNLLSRAAPPCTPVQRKRKITDDQKSRRQTRCNSWSRLEDVVLVGILIRKFVRKGSLFGEKEPGEKPEQRSCWREVKLLNDGIWGRLESVGITRPRQRVQTALSRRFKVIKASLETVRLKGGPSVRPTICELYEDFQKLNAHDVLFQDTSTICKEETIEPRQNLATRVRRI